MLDLQGAAGNAAVARVIAAAKPVNGPAAGRLPLQASLRVGSTSDPAEREADRVADAVVRGEKAGCHCGGSCEGCAAERVGRSAGAGSSFDAPPSVHDAIARPGSPLDASTRATLEPRFGADFSDVRIVVDPVSASEIGARAYTVGPAIVFDQGLYSPHSSAGVRLLAHELTHVVQQSGPTPEGGVLRRPAEDTLVRAAPARPAGPSPETCAPPAGMPCPPATSSSAGVVSSIVFPRDSATLDATQRMAIGAIVHAFRSQVFRVDGFASADGRCSYNWDLSCRRAQAITAELVTPSDGSAGVPPGSIDTFAHGETSMGGPAPASNRLGTISIPVPRPPSPRRPPINWGPRPGVP